MREPEKNPVNSLFAARQVLTVSQLTAQIKGSLERGFSNIEVRGQISNYKTHPSGHWYFTLKDARAQIRAVFYKQWNRLVRFTPENGMDVRLRGRVSVYEQRGEYQFIVDIIEPVGIGAQQLAFEQQHKRLAGLGFFDQQRKRKLPAFPQRIGVVTSLGGSVIRDILHVLSRRNPLIPILIAPARVQGAGAASEIANAINLLNRQIMTEGPEIEVIILARGGGGAEDLWAFNEEIVARAIFSSRIPIVSAVGHETDITIADLVADLRASTPSVAAEMVAPTAADLSNRVAKASGHLSRAMEHRLLVWRTRLQYLCNRRAFADAIERFQTVIRYYRELDERAARALEVQIQQAGLRLRHVERVLSTHDLRAPLKLASMRANTLSAQLRKVIDEDLAASRHRLGEHAARLEMLSPLRVLGRGYVVAKNEDGQIVTRASGLQVGDRLRLKFSDKEVGCEINQTD
jgi:exodeoxyribonuclease VII large subunit